MELPAEIRLNILRELLWTPEPLKILRKDFQQTNTLVRWGRPAAPRSSDGGITGINSSLFPEILAVCHKLNQEGGPVLYEENTMDVMVFCSSDQFHDPEVEWMGHRSSLVTIPRSFSARARKLRITVEVRSQFDDSIHMRKAVRKLVKGLQANPQWCSLDVRLEDNIPGHVRGEFSSNLDEEILRPLNLLRQLRHIKLTGVSPQFATELSELMKSDRPVIEPLKMYDNLEEYVDCFTTHRLRGAYREKDLELAGKAAEADNLIDFYDYRDKVIWEIHEFLAKKCAGVFRNDPDPI
jgi:hypothetical protein